ncbi:LEA type 2 family protein [Candidatus Binatia bacterium]|nr:LEA type 2 family protein [Candidatus Binatia bacterium]
MRLPQPFTSVLPVLVASTMAGCSLVGWRHPEALPTVTLRASTVTALSEGEIAATIVLTVRNPDSNPVRVGRVRYRLTFPGGAEAGGAVIVNATVPGGDGHLDIELPVRIAKRRLLPGAAPMLLLGELPYDLDVGVSIGAPLFGHTIDVQTSSALRLDLPLELVRPGPGRDPAGATAKSFTEGRTVFRHYGTRNPFGPSSRLLLAAYRGSVPDYAVALGTRPPV